MALNLQVFTDAGINMLGQADAGQILTIQRIVVGDGTANQDSDLYPLTALINWKEDVTITRKQDLGNGIMLVSGVLNEWDMTPGPPFELRELGIMAFTAPAGGGGAAAAASQSASLLPPATQASGAASASGASPIIPEAPAPGGGMPPLTKGPTPPSPPPPPSGDLLYCVSNVYGDPPQTITPEGTNSWAFDIHVEIDRATNVIINIGQVSTYDCQNIPVTPPPNQVSGGWYAGREGNVFDFKRVIQGPGIMITELPDRIMIGLAQLTTSVDLYCPNSGPNAYQNPPAGWLGFADINECVTYLKQFRIPADKFATIHIWKTTDGSPVLRATGDGFLVDHPDGKQISLWGQTRDDGCAINSISAAKVVAVTNAANLHVGQRVYLYGTHGGWVGGCRITAKSGSNVTCSILNLSGLPPWNSAYGAGGRVSFFPTTIDYNGTPSDPTNFVLNCPYGIKEIRDICFEGGYFCLAVAGGELNRVMAMGKTYGSFHTHRACSLDGNVGLGGECVFCDGDFGITVSGTMEAFDQTVINGCSQGLIPSAAGTALGWLIHGQLGAPFVCINHCYLGINSDRGTFVGGDIAFIKNGAGMKADQGGAITIAAESGHPSIPLNNGTDLWATEMGYIGFVFVPGQQLNCNPPADRRDGPNDNNQNSYIHLQPASQ